MKSTTSGMRHESVGIRPAVAITGQPALPVRREQAQRIPAFVTPRVRHLAALEHDVLDGAFGEAATDGEPGVTGADDDDVDGAHPEWSVAARSHRPPRRRWSGW